MPEYVLRDSKKKKEPRLELYLEENNNGSVYLMGWKEDDNSPYILLELHPSGILSRWNIPSELGLRINSRGEIKIAGINES